MMRVQVKRAEGSLLMHIQIKMVAPGQMAPQTSSLSLIFITHSFSYTHPTAG